MRITDQLTDTAILQLLGERLERFRIEMGLTQSELAQQAGVGKRTVERIESGMGAGLQQLIRVLRVLKLAEGLNALVPELPPSPMAELKLRGRQRRRAAHARRTRKVPHDAMSDAAHDNDMSDEGPSARPKAASPANETSSRKQWTWGA